MQNYIGGLHNIYSFFYIAAGIASLPFCSLILWEGLKKIRLTYFLSRLDRKFCARSPAKDLVWKNVHFQSEHDGGRPMAN